ETPGISMSGYASTHRRRRVTTATAEYCNTCCGICWSVPANGTFFRLREELESQIGHDLGKPGVRRIKHGCTAHFLTKDRPFVRKRLEPVQTMRIADSAVVYPAKGQIGVQIMYKAMVDART